MACAIGIPREIQQQGSFSFQCAPEVSTQGEIRLNTPLHSRAAHERTSGHGKPTVERRVRSTFA